MFQQVKPHPEEPGEAQRSRASRRMGPRNRLLIPGTRAQHAGKRRPPQGENDDGGKTLFASGSSRGIGPMLMPRLLALRKSKALWSVAVVTVAVLVVASAALRDDGLPGKLRAAVSQSSSDIRIYGLRCLSVDPHNVVVDQKQYSDPRLVETIVDILSIKTVLLEADNMTCPWGFFVTVVPGLVSAVRLHGEPARYLVSIGVCERKPGGALNPGKCLNKNVYVFNSDVEPHGLLSVALVGLARSQTQAWEVFQSTRSQ